MLIRPLLAASGPNLLLDLADLVRKAIMNQAMVPNCLFSGLDQKDGLCVF